MDYYYYKYLTTSIYPSTVSNSPVAASRRSLIMVFPEPGNPANPVLVKKRKSTRDGNICQLEKITWRMLVLDWWSKDQSSSELRAHRDKPGIRIEISLKLSARPEQKMFTLVCTKVSSEITLLERTQLSQEWVSWSIFLKQKIQIPPPRSGSILKKKKRFKTLSRYPRK